MHWKYNLVTYNFRKKEHSTREIGEDIKLWLFLLLILKLLVLQAKVMASTMKFFSEDVLLYQTHEATAFSPVCFDIYVKNTYC